MTVPLANPTDKIAALWQRSLPTVRARVDLLTRAAEATRTQTLDEALRDEAHTTAHKLAGSLGMFGQHKAGELARQIEQLYETSATPNTTALTAALREALFQK